MHNAAQLQPTDTSSNPQLPAAGSSDGFLRLGMNLDPSYISIAVCPALWLECKLFCLYT